MHNAECFASNENDHDLASNHDEIYGHEKPITTDALKDIKLVVKSTIARSWLALLEIARCEKFYSLPLIENLHPYESIEDKGGNLFLFVVRLVGKDCFRPIVEQERNSELKNCFSNDHLPHSY